MEEELKTVSADLSIEVNVTCPECDETFDLLRKTNLNEEGYVLRETISDDAWARESEDRLDTDCTCPECKAEFHIKGVLW